MEIFNLSGRVAIVTGGNQGIGLAIAQGLARAGASIVIANRRVAEGQKAAEALIKEGLKAMAIHVDISHLSSITQLVDRVISQFGKIDILVNNAAVIIRKPAIEIAEADWDYIMSIDLKGYFFCAQFAAREMIKQKKGKIINLSSIVSQVAEVPLSVYAIAKAGVNHMTRSLALEWAKYNINVNTIAPGLTITERNRQFYAEHPERKREIIASIPKGREGFPEDCAGAAVFLASDASDYMTGQVLFVDGGITIH